MKTLKTIRNEYKLILQHKGIENGIILAVNNDKNHGKFATWIAVNDDTDHTAHGNYFSTYEEAFEDYLYRIKNSYDAFGDRFLKGVK